MAKSFFSLLFLMFVLTANAQDPTLQTGTVATTICRGASLSVPYSSSADFDAGNVFTAQLSDAAGSFAAPVNIGSSSAVSSGSISVSIPSNTATGSSYRIRVVGSAPVVTGSDNGNDITINAPPQLLFTGLSANCPGNSTTITASGASSYSWSLSSLPGDASGASAKMLVGLRRLKTGYNGFVLRLRRASDNTEMDFGLSGDNLDLDAINTWLDGTTGYGVQLYDQSGNNNHMQQASWSFQPLFVSVGQNGRPILRFTDPQRMQCATTFTNPNTTIYAGRLTGGADRRVLSSFNNNWLLGWWNGYYRCAHYDGWVYQGLPVADQSVHVFTATTVPGLGKIFENGRFIASGGASSPPNGLQISGIGTSELSNCEVYEIAVYDAVLSDVERNKVESNMWQTWSNPAQLFITPPSSGTISVEVTGTTAGCSSTETISASATVPGDPAVFGSGIWNVYVFNSGNGNINNTDWQTNYSGYYTESTLSFNTQNRWCNNCSPSEASGYQGCVVGVDNHSWSAKREGFTCANYRIDIPTHDDGAQLWINGSMVWQHQGCCDNHTGVWTGFLGPTDKVEYRVTEGGGGSHGQITFTVVPLASISYPSPLCVTSTATVTLTGQTGGTFSAAPAGLSINATTGAIDGSQSQAGTYTVTYNLQGTSCSGAYNESVTAQITIVSVAGDPSVFGSNSWNVYAFNSGNGNVSFPGTWVNNYAGYYTSNVLNFNTQNDWGTNASPSAASSYQGCPVGVDGHSWTAKREGFPCAYYRLNITNHDDGAQIFVNGTKVWEAGCCGNSGEVWRGYLGATDKVEFRVTEGGGGSNGSISFTVIPAASISYAANILCGNAAPMPVTRQGLSGGTYTATPAGLAINASTGAIDPVLSTTGTYTVTYTVQASTCNGPATVTATAQVTVTGAQGNPAVFGNNQWNVYAWNSGNSSLSSNPWTTNYAGYYTNSNLNFSTLDNWCDGCSPSAASNYQGCPVGNDYHSWSAKRQGFTCGYYRIDITTHDDAAQLWVNGSKVWEHDNCCDAHPGAWVGYLGPNDRVEFRATEGYGGSNGSITFTQVSPNTISYGQGCTNGPSLSPTRTGAGGGSYNSTPAGLSIDAVTGVINSSASQAGTYTVSYTQPATAGCTVLPATTQVRLKAPDYVNQPGSTITCNGSSVPATPFTGSANTTFEWSNSDTSIGLPASGTGNLPGFVAVNNGDSLRTATITVRPVSAGRYAYILALDNAQLSIVNTATNLIDTTFSVPGYPSSVAVTNGHIYLSDYYGNSVMVYNEMTRAFETRIVTGQGPLALAAHPTQPLLYVLNQSDYTLSVINCATNSLVQTISGFYYPQTMAISPDGSKLAVGNYDGSVMLVNTATNSIGATISVSYPIGLVFAPNGNTLYVSDQGDLSIRAFSMSNNAQIQRVALTNYPYAIDITPDGTSVLVALDNSIGRITTATGAVTYSGNIGSYTYNLSITADGKRVYAVQTYDPTYSVLRISDLSQLSIGNLPVYSYSVGDFIPDGSFCAPEARTFTISVHPTPNAAISYAASPFCANGSSAAVTRTGTAGGTYSAGAGLFINPQTGSIDPAQSQPGIYTVTYSIAAAGGCSSFSTTTSVEVLAATIPMDPVASQVVCNGGRVHNIVFSGGGNNPTYSWTNDNTAIGLAASGSGTIPEFFASNTTNAPIVANITVSNGAAACASSGQTFSITVLPTPSVNSVSNEVLCANTSAGPITFSGAANNYSWTNSNPAIGLAASGTGAISFTTANNTNAPLQASISVTPQYVLGNNTCSGKGMVFTVTVQPTVTMNPVTGQTVCAGNATSAVNFAGAPAGTTYIWSNDNSQVGLVASGAGNIPSFTAQNSTPVTQVANISVTPWYNHCAGATRSFAITVQANAGLFSYTGSPYCPIGEAYATRGGSAVGTFSASPAGLVINSSTGAVNLGQSVPGTYTVTFTVSGATCNTQSTASIIILPPATVNTVGNQVYCNGAITAPISFGGSGGSYTWTNSNPSIGLAASGTGNLPSFVATNNGSTTQTATILVTPQGAAGASCKGRAVSFRIQVFPTPSVNAVSPQIYCRGMATNAVTFSGPVIGTTYNWTANNQSVGLPSGRGSNSIASFTTISGNVAPVSSTISVVPIANKCVGSAISFSYTVNACVAQAGNPDGEPATARLADQVQIGPNPSKDRVTVWITGKAHGVRTVEILDQNGRSLVRPASFSGNSYTVDLSGLPAGSYMLRIVDAVSKETVQRKVIKL